MNRTTSTVIVILLFVFIVSLLPGFPGYVWDNNYWTAWASYIKIHGLGNIYGSPDPKYSPDYPPVYMYLLWLFGMLAGSVQNIAAHIPLLRSFTLVFDFAGLWFVYRWTDKKTPYVVILLLCMLNIGYSYDTIIWGQVDGILATLIFITVYYAYSGQMLISTIWMVIALNFKLQAMFILPVWGLLFINNIISQPGWKKVIYPIITAVVLQAILLLPFIMGQYGLGKLPHILTGSFDKYPTVSMNAPNFWILAFPYSVWSGSDAAVWISGLTYKDAGLLLFFTTSFLTLLPLMVSVLRRLNKRYRHTVISRELVWLTGALIYMLFFYFNTEMHERYCYPAFIFIVAYAFYKKDFSGFILFSITIFLTLEGILHSLKLGDYNILIFKVRILAALFGVIIIYLGSKIYLLSKKGGVYMPGG